MNERQPDRYPSDLHTNIARLMGRIGTHHASERARKLLIALARSMRAEQCEHLLAIIAMTATQGNQVPTSHVTPALDQFVTFLDTELGSVHASAPTANLPATALLTLVTSNGGIFALAMAFLKFATGKPQHKPRPSMTATDLPPAPSLTAPAEIMLEKLNPTRSGPFARELLDRVRRLHDDVEFEILLDEVTRIGGLYPHLRPVYCVTPLAEIVREARGTLKQLWRIEDLTCDDVAQMFDERLLATIETRLRQRARLPE